MLRITDVNSNGVGAELGLEAGDALVSFDGEEFEDILDYYYIDGETKFTLTVKTKQGDICTCDVEKLETESLGLEFDGTELTPRRCANKCIFCFVDQLPEGMRETLYLKDDDWKLSFICGNYVTLTNVTEKEIERIVKRGFSPLYISVHATDANIRAKLLGRKKPAPVIPYLKRFGDAGIVMHTQIVMVGGINDGDVLEQTLNDLNTLYPSVRSVSVVPVGLTGHRDGLYPLTEISKETAERAIDITEKINGDRDWCYCSDEMYIIAERTTKSAEYYGNNYQLENGVGMIPAFLRGIETSLKGSELVGDYGVVTGKATEKIFSDICVKLTSENPELKLKVYPIINNFFGTSITVSGLVTGRDIITQLKGKDLPETLLLPRVMFKEFEIVMLDGTTVEDLERELKVKVKITETSGEKFIDALKKE